MVLVQHEDLKHSGTQELPEEYNDENIHAWITACEARWNDSNEAKSNTSKVKR